MTQIASQYGYDAIADRLARFGNFRKLWKWLHALAWFIILGPGAILAVIAIDALCDRVPSVQLGGAFTLNVTVVAPELDGRTVAVAVDERDARDDVFRPLVVQQDIHVGRDATRIPFQISPTSPGVRSYRVSLHAAKDSVDLERFQGTRTVDVRSTRLRRPAQTVELRVPSRWWNPLPWFVLLPLAVLATALTIYSAIRHAIRPLLAEINVDREALVIESLHGRLDNQVIGSLHLSREMVLARQTGKPLGHSGAIVAALVAQTSYNLDRINLSSLVDRRKTYWLLSFAGGVVLAFAVLGIITPKVFGQRIDHLREAYTLMMDWLFKVHIEADSAHVAVIQTPVTMGQLFAAPVVSSEDVSVTRGSPVALRVRITNARRKNVRLILTDLKTKAETSQDLILGPDRQIILPAFAAEQSFSYQFENSGQRSVPHKVLIGDVPSVVAMNTELTYPSYTGMPSRTLIGRIPRIQALQGTDVLVSIATTVDLDPRRSYVTFSGGEMEELSITGRFAHFAFRVDREKDAAIHLTGSLGNGFEMREPITFKIIPQYDQPPKAELLLSPKTRALGATADGLPMLAEEAAHFGVSAIAEDDFGVAEMSLNYKIDTRNVHLTGLPQRDAAGYTVSVRIDPTRDRVKHSFTEIFKNISPPLMPGERVTISVSAIDNNPTPGTGMSRPPFTFTVVQPDLGAYVEQQFGFGTDPLLGGLRRVQRATNLLIEAERTTHTEKKAIVEKQDVKSRVGAENWPGGSQDAVGDYFRLLSGEK